MEYHYFASMYPQPSDYNNDTTSCNIEIDEFSIRLILKFNFNSGFLNPPAYKFLYVNLCQALPKNQISPQ